jgi:excisionase family DNA binding protein
MPAGGSVLTLTERVALTRTEAADSLGVSVDHFERHVQPQLRIVRAGRLVLVRRAELERWARESETAAV